MAVPKRGMACRASADESKNGPRMISRREFMQVALAAAALTGVGGRLGRLAAQQAIRQEDLLHFAPKGQLTILHAADIHAQLRPIYFREPSINLGVGDAKGVLRHITGQDFLSAFAMPQD